jgi:hypothetical protein
MNIGNERHIRSFVDLLHRSGRIIVGHGDTNDLAPGLDHFLDLTNRRIDISRVSLCHRLDDDRRTTADLYVTDLNRFCNSRHFYMFRERAEARTLAIDTS